MQMPHPFLGKLKYRYIHTHTYTQQVTGISNTLPKKKELTSSLVRQHAHLWPGGKSSTFLITWHCMQSPGGPHAFTTPSQNSAYFIHDKKGCNYVRAILLTLGSKNAKAKVSSVTISVPLYVSFPFLSRRLPFISGLFVCLFLNMHLGVNFEREESGKEGGKEFTAV